MKNKRAWLRIVEAIFGILIIFGSILYFVTIKNPKTNVSEIVFDKQQKILEVISKNESMREKIILEDSLFVEGEINKLVPNSWNYTIKICELNDICNSDKTPLDRDVFVTERLITTTLSNYAPKKIKFFVWMKR